VEECGEERQDGEDVHLGDAEELGWVHVVPVAEFVRQDCLHFFGFALFDQGIKDNDVFALSDKILSDATL
jgi:hypothetical protein